MIKGEVLKRTGWDTVALPGTSTQAYIVATNAAFARVGSELIIRSGNFYYWLRVTRVGLDARSDGYKVDTVISAWSHSPS